MKKLIYSLICAASALLVVSCMGVDNFDAPDCHFYGKALFLIEEIAIFASGR